MMSVDSREGKLLSKSLTFFNPFISYNWKSGAGLTLNTEYTHDWINDIDVLIPKKSFSQVVEILEKESLDFQYIEVYPDNGMSTITVRNNKKHVKNHEVIYFLIYWQPLDISIVL